MDVILGVEALQLVSELFSDLKKVRLSYPTRCCSLRGIRFPGRALKDEDDRQVRRTLTGAHRDGKEWLLPNFLEKCY